jgi:adenosylcobyric acid synthase
VTTGLEGALMVCATASDSGKSTIVTGLCRLLARRGVAVAPFKAQNMALNSAVTASGAEIGRAQAAQAHAAGVEPEAAMNPVLLKPQSDRTSQVVVMGRPWATLDAQEYQAAKGELWDVVLEQLGKLRRRFDVVLCEGAGSAAEINLLDDDIVNLRLAHAAGMRALVAGDIDRGGVFAALYGTVSLLPEHLRSTVGGFVINKFRGDPAILDPAPKRLEELTGIRTLGIVPWIETPLVDAEDSLDLRRLSGSGSGPGSGPDGGAIDVAVIRLPRISNFTDMEALAFEPSVRIRLVDEAAALGHPDLLIIPGTKSTLADLNWLRANGLAPAICRLASGEPRSTILGICGGYQMLGEKIDDSVESSPPQVTEGLALLGTRTTFDTQKTTRRRKGIAFGEAVEGYEIHHGRTPPAQPWVRLDNGDEEGSSAADGRILGTNIHGIFESDAFRRAFMSDVAARAGKTWTAGQTSFAAQRIARADRIADALEQHLDIAAVERLIGEAGR